MWSGSIGSIPSGWYLCDGSNGTPNLTDRFIVGAGASYAVNATGGATTATLTTNNLPAHTHVATVTDPGHFHSTNSLTSGSGVAGGASFTNISFSSGTSTTGITVTNASTGSGTSFSILPTYYALAYIQKS
jgi:microcystin-dependent protein